MPFADYYAGNYLNSFDEIVQKTILFVPFGFLLSSGDRNPRFETLVVVLLGIAFGDRDRIRPGISSL